MIFRWAGQSAVGRFIGSPRGESPGHVGCVKLLFRYLLLQIKSGYASRRIRTNEEDGVVEIIRMKLRRGCRLASPAFHKEDKMFKKILLLSTAICAAISLFMFQPTYA